MATVTDNKSATRPKKIYMDYCWECQRDIPDDEPLVKAFFPNQIGNARVRNKCTDCMTKWDKQAYEDRALVFGNADTVCPGCGRKILICSGRFHVSPYCSSRCYQFANRKITSRTVTHCNTCNELFTPKRSDSKYCSSKCRQKAYRQRGGE